MRTSDSANKTRALRCRPNIRIQHITRHRRWKRDTLQTRDSLENARFVRAPQNGDCHQFPPLELVGCTGLYPVCLRLILRQVARPISIPPDEVLPHNATDTKFPAQFAGNCLSVPGFAPRETRRLSVSGSRRRNEASVDRKSHTSE